jgi:site-specific recombinase
MMKVGKHTAFMVDFVSDFADGEISRYNFEMDYSGYIIKHFPLMEKEDACLAQKFADTVDSTVEYAGINNISDDDFRILINNSICDFLGIDDPDIE